MPRYTILLPVLRPPDLIPFAIRSVQAQTEADFRLVVICDGAPDATAECAEAFAAEDPRISVYPFPKGRGNGEDYRAFALDRADSAYVAQIADDDLWLPEHLAELGRLLETVAFGHLLQTDIGADGKPAILAGDLADPAIRRHLIERNENYFGPTVAGYRLSAYRGLAEGWTPAPAGVFSDLHMWRKFLTAGIPVGTRFSIQSVKLASALRPGMPLDQRRRENAAWARRLATEDGRRGFQAEAWQNLFWHGRTRPD